MLFFAVFGRKFKKKTIVYNLIFSYAEIGAPFKYHFLDENSFFSVYNTHIYKISRL